MVAMGVMAVMAVMMTACDKNDDLADPATEPVTGKTYIHENEDGQGGYIKLTFHAKHTMTQVTRENASAKEKSSSKFKWQMRDGNIIDVVKSNGYTLVYSGSYDATTGDLTLYTDASFTSELIFHEVKD